MTLNAIAQYNLIVDILTEVVAETREQDNDTGSNIINAIIKTLTSDTWGMSHLDVALALSDANAEVTDRQNT